MKHAIIRVAAITGLLGLVSCGTSSDAAADRTRGDTAAPPVEGAPALAAANVDPLVLRPGDRITWSPDAPHRVQFGGTVTVNGAALPLTPFADVQKVLTDFQPPLTPNAQGVAVAPAGTRVTARVRDDAHQAGVASFFFTCGFSPHRSDMVTVGFTIAAPDAAQPARDVQIRSSDDPLAWMLRTDQGDISLDRT